MLNLPEMLTDDDGVTEDQLAVTDEYICSRIRRNFYLYRFYLTPEMLHGWWQREVARHLMQFYADFKAGKRPKLLLQSPPQHGKSTQVMDLLSWIYGDNPDLGVIFTSYSDELGVRCNLGLQRRFTSQRYEKLFPKTRLSSQSQAGEGEMLRQTQRMFEFVDAKGKFRNTTVAGKITGESMDIGIIDDPVAGREAANSELKRNKVWDWFSDDFFPRFSKSAGFLMIMTRWHVDDPAGRFIERMGSENVKQLKYPALAEIDERCRKKGEPLFPEHKPMDLLMEQRKLMTQGSWEAEYQQNPIIVGGGIFPIKEFEILDRRPPRDQVLHAVRYWDKAGTHGDGAYTAGVRMERLRSGKFVVTDVQRAQLGHYQREQLILDTAKIDNSEGWSVDTWVEQEPGSGGKESAERTVMNLAGFSIRRDRVKGDKELRAEPYAAQVQGGNVGLVASERWNRPFLDEHEQFPNGKFKDQVDAAGGAFTRLALSRFQPATGVGGPIGVKDGKRIDSQADEEERKPRNVEDGPRNYISVSREF